MASGPLLPSSVYFGAASGNCYPAYYTSNTNTNTASYIEGVGVIASLTGDAPVTMQFNLPEVIPSGTCKLRVLAWANATSNAAKVDILDGQTAVGSNIGATSLTTEAGSPTISQTWTTADVIVENKVNLTTSPTANNILTVKALFRTSGWTLAVASVWQFSIVWE